MCLVQSALAGPDLTNWVGRNANDFNSNMCDRLDVQYQTVWSSDLKAFGTKIIAVYNRVYIADQGMLRAEDLHSGIDEWSDDLASQSSESTDKMHITGIAFYRGAIYAGLSSAKAGMFCSIDAETGKANWTLPNVGTQLRPVLSEPAFWKNSIILRVGTEVLSLRTGDGALQWSTDVPFLHAIQSTMSAHPAIDDDRIYFNSDMGVAFALDAKSGRVLWSYATGGYSSVSAASITETHVSVTYCAPLLLSDKVFVADDNTIYCLDSATGKLHWKVALGHPFDFASTGKNLYAATSTGFYELSPETGSILDSRTLSGGVWACAVAKDRAVLTHNPVTTGGWEVLDLHSWRPAIMNADLRIDPVLCESGGILFLVGTDMSPNKYDSNRRLMAFAGGK